MPAYPGSKLIFTVLIHRCSPEEFTRQWEEGAQSGLPSGASLELKERFRHLYRSSSPPIHRYNNIAGFAEVYWDGGTRILVDYYFLGDRRTMYGKKIAERLRCPTSANKYYLYADMVESGSFRLKDSVDQKRKAVLVALKDVAITAKSLRCHVDLEAEMHIANSLDLARLFA